jgi:hypothetical protein
LSPRREWAHITNFFNIFDRVDEKKYQKIEGDMLADYRAKEKELGKKEAQNIVHPEELLIQQANR